MFVKTLRIFVLLGIALASCNRPVEPTPTSIALPGATLTHSPQPTTQPPTSTFAPTRTPTRRVTPTPLPTEPEAVREYLERLKKNFFPGDFCCLSKDGQWMLAGGPLRYDVDTLDVVSVNDPQNIIRLPVPRALIQPPPDSKSFIGGYYSSRWSPDSTGIASYGGFDPNLAVFPVLLIYDIGDPLNVKSAVFKPEESKLPEFDGYPGNAVFLQPRWSPDSSKILVMFGVTAYSARDYGWIVDRNGQQVLKELSTRGYNTLFWMDDRLIGAKDSKEIWLIDPWRDTQERLYVSETEIEIIEYKSSYNQLLLAELSDGCLAFLVFDMQARQVVAQTDKDGTCDVATGYTDQYIDTVVSTPLHYSAINHGYFRFFDWETHTLSEPFEQFDLVGWYPIVNGFIVSKESDNSLQVIRP